MESNNYESDMKENSNSNDIDFYIKLMTDYFYADKPDLYFEGVKVIGKYIL